MYTFSENIKYREEDNSILISDCKRLIDLELDLKFRRFLDMLNKGLDKNMIKNKDEILLLKDFQKLNFISPLTFRKIKSKEFKLADNLLNKELFKDRKRPRSYKFLYNKFRSYPYFFIGAFLSDKLIGVIQGFPRDNYLLISELVVDSRFRKRGVGKLLVEEFEKVAKCRRFDLVRLGAENNAIKFYKSLNYKPSILIQIKKGKFNMSKIKNYKIISIKTIKSYKVIEIKINKIDLNLLKKIKLKTNADSTQYLFSKRFN